MLKKILNWILGVEETDRKDMLQEIEKAEQSEVDTAMDEVMTLKEMPPAATMKKPAKKRVTKKKPVKKKTTKKKTTKKKSVKKKATKKKPTKKKAIKKKTTKKKAVKKTAKKSKAKKKVTKKESLVKYLKSSKAPKSIDAIAKKVGITTQTARRYLFYLKKEGKVTTKNSGWVSK